MSIDLRRRRGSLAVVTPAGLEAGLGPTLEAGPLPVRPGSTLRSETGDRKTISWLFVAVDGLLTRCFVPV